ncbi:MAG: hypothetical protein ACJ8EL_01335, partial [Rhizomicrobium sp.]
GNESRAALRIGSHAVARQQFLAQRGLRGSFCSDRRRFNVGDIIRSLTGLGRDLSGRRGLVCAWLKDEKCH